MTVTKSLYWFVKSTCDMEVQIISVERIKEYSEIPSEAAWNIEHEPVQDNWPESGKVQIDCYSVRYRKGLDLVLDGITCHILAGEKVGLVGRTGAGKSSLALGLFRITESNEGRIHIDGIDITEIGLHKLRSSLTIIPQDPLLFSGTLRYNLDPFDKYTDAEIWEALKCGYLCEFVKSLKNELDHEVSENGENFSIGQRQLICLCRALLRKTKIIVLDEATASIDIETDEIIQSMIRKRFSDCTIITIAHRISTVIDYTRILVLDEGRLMEYDSPENLLHNGESQFYKMARNAGLV
ncbi:multidrug resistance-associated protein 1-like [Tubulanus polymorphus]|uniref:multidrug resistance-associated protein 1-like n=1 Tax=Tubulanus polymorphus TaxID=672921 RepID=UPI003DA35D4D